MAYTHNHTIYLTIGSNEIACEIEYTVEPGEPERGPTYACGGTPASPAEVDIRSVTAVIEKWHGREKRITRYPVEGWLLSLITNCPDINADLISEAEDEGGPDPDAGRDQRIDDALTMNAAE